MADTNLHIAKPKAEPPLDEHFHKLLMRVSEMEDVLRGAQGVLHAIQAGGLLDSLPKDEADRPGHEAALAMLTLLKGRADSLVDHDEDWDCSCELATLRRAAETGTIRRFRRVDE